MPEQQSIPSAVDAVARLFQPPSERVTAALREAVAAHGAATAELLQGLAAAKAEPVKALGLLGDFCTATNARILGFSQLAIDDWQAGVSRPSPSESAPARPSTGSVAAYCVRCKAQRPVSNPVATTMKNGRPALKGSCSACGAGMFKIGG
jgi:Domain of unknown function (DUF5679)